MDEGRGLDVSFRETVQVGVGQGHRTDEAG